MRSSLIAIPLVTLIGLAMAAGTARADCSTDIQAVEQHLGSLSGKEKQRGKMKVAQDLVNKAKDALSEGKTKRCEKLALKAREKIK